MKAIHGFVAVVVAVASIGTAPAGAWASEQLFSQLPDGQSTYGPSESWAPAGINSEIADDFEATGNIDRVFASGFIRGLHTQNHSRPCSSKKTPDDGSSHGLCQPPICGGCLVRTTQAFRGCLLCRQ
jgi:hypothetical protein